ncbi:MAG: potassium channel family protein [Haloferacaceae archaeon]
MQSFPVQILLGIYLGVLSGIIPAVVAGVLGFIFRYFTGVSIPGFGVVVLALAVAGINGGLLALNDPTIKQGENATAFIVAILVVLMLALYAHAKGDKLGSSLPRRMSLRALTARTLSTDVVELVGGRGQVRITPVGEVGDMEGYPPLPAELRGDLRDGEWTFPADVPLAELETRLADRLRTDYDLADVSVRLDERARATIAAAPPVGGLSRRVPAGKRAVSVDALLPTGVARGEEVRVGVGDTAVTGTVVSAKTSGSEEPLRKAVTLPTGTPPGGESTDGEPAPDGGRPRDPRTDGGEEAAEAPTLQTPVTTGGEGRLTVAVDRGDAAALLGAERGRVVVRSRGTRREFELTALLRRVGQRIRRVTVASEGPLDDVAIGEAKVHDVYGVAILAVRHGGEWQVAPRGETRLAAGDELFVVGTRDALASFAEAAA